MWFRVRLGASDVCLFAQQFDRVRVIYKYALDLIPKQNAQELFKYYTTFEKKYGDRRGIEDVIVGKRRFQYEEEVKVSTFALPAFLYMFRLISSAVKTQAWAIDPFPCCHAGIH